MLGAVAIAIGRSPDCCSPIVHKFVLLTWQLSKGTQKIVFDGKMKFSIFVTSDIRMGWIKSSYEDKNQSLRKKFKKF
jgi:hypothetical protein